MVVRSIAIISSLLSLSIGFATWRQFTEDSRSRKHIGVDILWNIISISPRVIALALFASFEPYWFWELVISQLLIVTVIAFIAAWKEDKKPTRIEDTQEVGDCKQREGKEGRLFDFFMSCFTGTGMVFNMCHGCGLAGQ